MRMAGKASTFRGDRLDTIGVSGIANVVDQRPSAVERGGPEIVRIPAHRVASGIADTAIDTFNSGIGGLAFGGRRLDLLDLIVTCLRRDKRALRLLPFIEERTHVGGEVLDDGQV